MAFDGEHCHHCPLCARRMVEFSLSFTILTHGARNPRTVFCAVRARDIGDNALSLSPRVKVQQGQPK